MGRQIANVGAGAVSGYAGAYTGQAGEDVTFVADPWSERIGHVTKHGLSVTRAEGGAGFPFP
jgi:2-dehydropantoate 2-reductase